jgi:hypothetical protein
MKILLDRYSANQIEIGSLAEDRAVDVEVEGRRERWRLPRQSILCGALAWLGPLPASIPVTALLDTGADLTLVKAAKVEELEDALGVAIPVIRRIRANGVMKDAFDFTFLLPETMHPCVSAYGFLRVDDADLGAVDFLLGQDLLKQWIVTLDGVNGTVTIGVPE